MGKGVKGCNCPICQADRDGTGDIIGAAAAGTLFLFIVLVAVLVIILSIF